jgi:hypothetical protein
MHINLFRWAGTRREVREAMERDQKRDRKVLQWWDFLLALSLAYLARDLPLTDLLAVLVAAFAGMSGLRYFIDLAVRNYYLHRLDWEAAGEDDPR